MREPGYAGISKRMNGNGWMVHRVCQRTDFLLDRSGALAVFASAEDAVKALDEQLCHAVDMFRDDNPSFSHREQDLLALQRDKEELVEFAQLLLARLEELDPDGCRQEWASHPANVHGLMQAMFPEHVIRTPACEPSNG